MAVTWPPRQAARRQAAGTAASIVVETQGTGTGPVVRGSEYDDSPDRPAQQVGRQAAGQREAGEAGPGAGQGAGRQAAGQRLEQQARQQAMIAELSGFLGAASDGPTTTMRRVPVGGAPSWQEGAATRAVPVAGSREQGAATRTVPIAPLAA